MMEMTKMSGFSSSVKYLIFNRSIDELTEEDKLEIETAARKEREKMERERQFV